MSFGALWQRVHCKVKRRLLWATRCCGRWFNAISIPSILWPTSMRNVSSVIGYKNRENRPDSIIWLIDCSWCTNCNLNRREMLVDRSSSTYRMVHESSLITPNTFEYITNHIMAVACHIQKIILNKDFHSSVECTNPRFSLETQCKAKMIFTVFFSYASRTCVCVCVSVVCVYRNRKLKKSVKRNSFGSRCWHSLKRIAVIQRSIHYTHYTRTHDDNMHKAYK